jgi:hypothetical protein
MQRRGTMIEMDVKICTTNLAKKAGPLHQSNKIKGATITTHTTQQEERPITIEYNRA